GAFRTAPKYSQQEGNTSFPGKIRDAARSVEMSRHGPVRRTIEDENRSEWRIRSTRETPRHECLRHDFRGSLGLAGRDAANMNVCATPLAPAFSRTSGVLRLLSTRLAPGHITMLPFDS